MAGLKRSRAMRRWRPRKKARILRRPTWKRQVGVVNVKRTFNYGYWQPSTTATTDFWKYFTFRFYELPTYTEFTNVFDRYKLNGIKVTFRPRFNGFTGDNTTDTTLPGVTNQAGANLHIINDPYSITAPSGTYTRTNMNLFLEQGNVRSYNGNKVINVFFKPTTYETVDGVATGRLKRPGWISSAANPLFYGFHAFAQDFNMTGSFGQSWDIFVTFYMQFTGLR